MNTTVSSIPKVYYTYRKAIYKLAVASDCLIVEIKNPSDAMTKARDSGMLKRASKAVNFVTLSTRRIMLQLWN